MWRCRELLHIALCLGGLSLALSRQGGTSGNITQDALQFLSSVNKGLGFYWGKPYITSLTDDTFDQVVLNSSSSWVIEFYQSWCGYCLRYSTTFKRFAKDLFEWRPIVKVAAVDCNHNSALCRRFGVMHVPSVKYLPAFFNNNHDSVVQLDQRKGDEPRKTPAQLRQSIVEQLLKRPDLHEMLKPLHSKSSKQLWRLIPKNFKWAVILTICPNSPTLGREIFMDYLHTDVVVVLEVCRSGLINHLKLPTHRFSSVYAVNRDDSTLNANLNKRPIDRAETLAALKSFFELKGIKVPAPFNPDSVPKLNITKAQLLEYAKTHSDVAIPFDHSNMVYQVDIEAAVDHSITHEIAQAQVIEGPSFKALVEYLGILKKYFPAVKNGKRMLTCLHNTVATKRKTTGIEVLGIYRKCINRYEPVYLDPNNGYLGCRGSLSMFRGFPCSMWMLFHTLSVQAYNRRDPDPKVVLKAMVGYVKNFFACEDCAEHFLKVAKTMPDRFKNIGESVLWLSEAHNKANVRLHGDATEDPLYPKVRFPPRKLCPACYNSDGSFNDGRTLRYLVNMYTNIDQHVLADFKAGRGNVLSSMKGGLNR